MNRDSTSSGLTLSDLSTFSSCGAGEMTLLKRSLICVGSVGASLIGSLTGSLVDSASKSVDCAGDDSLLVAPSCFRICFATSSTSSE